MSNKITNTYEIKEDYAILKIKGSIHGDFDVHIDIEDVNRCKEYSWNVNKYGSKKKSYYIINKEKGLLHRFIMDCPKDKVVDHINGDTLNNKKAYLNICTIKQNVRKSSLATNNTSGYTGVIWYDYCKTPKWMAYIKVDRKLINLGYFTDLEEAIKVRKEAELKYYGEFAPQKHLDI